MFTKLFKFYLKNLLIIFLFSNISYLLVGNNLNKEISFILEKYFINYTVLKIILLEILLLILDFILIIFLIIKTDDYKLNSELLKKNLLELKSIFKNNDFETVKKKNNEIISINKKIDYMTRNSKYYKIKRSNYLSCYIKLNNYFNICFVFFWVFIWYLLKGNFNKSIEEEVLYNLFLIIILFQINNLKNIIQGIIYEIEYKKLRKYLLIFLNFLEIYFSVNLLLKTIIYKLIGLRNTFIFIYGLFIILIFKNITRISIFNEILIIYIQFISKFN